MELPVPNLSQHTIVVSILGSAQRSWKIDKKLGKFQSFIPPPIKAAAQIRFLFLKALYIRFQMHTGGFQAPLVGVRVRTHSWSFIEKAPICVFNGGHTQVFQLCPGVDFKLETFPVQKLSEANPSSSRKLFQAWAVKKMQISENIFWKKLHNSEKLKK